MSDTLHTGVDAATPADPEVTPSTVETPADPETEPYSEGPDVTALNDEVLGEVPVDAVEDLPVDPKFDSEIAAEVDAETEGKATEPAAVPADAVVEEIAKPAEAAPTPAATVEEAKAEVELAVPVEPAEPEESFADIFSEFQRTHVRREDGASQIRGTVVAVTEDSVLVDIGFKSEGILPLAAFAAAKEKPKVGDALTVSPKGRDEDGYYQLSLFKTAVPKDWSSLERAFAEKTTIVGTVTAVVKGGLHVDCGIRAFLPASRSGARDAAEMEKLIGEEIRVRITKLDVADEDLVVDRRVVTEEEALASKEQRYAEVREGAILNGTVRTIMEYGAFVELGGVDGLLHISDIAWSRVANVGDVLTVGQQIEVKVLKIDPETRRIALGLKQLQAHPWDSVAEKFALGQKVRGVVSRIADFGAFVELEPGVEGLVHLSEMSYTKRILKATEVVKVGDAVDAVILAISVPERRISLGLKQALGDPWEDAAKRFVPGSIIEGPVSSILKFGAFVQAAEGVEGMVHISEIVADRRLNHPSDVLRVGQVVKALVLELDKEKRQMRLSMKQLIPTSLDEFVTEHKAGDLVTGRIVSIADGVAQVELGEGIVCACKLPAAAAAATPEPAAAGKVDLSAFSSMLKTKWKTGAVAGAAETKKAPEAGQVRSFRITQLDAAAKHISLELIP